VSATGRFEYLLAEYLMCVEDGNSGSALQIVLAMWHRWPDRWHRWVGRHPEDIPDTVRGHLTSAGLEHILEGSYDENSESVTAGSDGRGIGVLITLPDSQMQAA
jgi:hypothetical protein